MIMRDLFFKYVEVPFHTSRTA